MTEQRGGSSGQLSTGDPAPVPPAPPTVEMVGEDNIKGRFQAVINVHDCNLNQIEVAIGTNAHEIDPHPIQPGRYVERHPVYLVAFDPSNVDAEGHPAEGKPSELNLKLIREVFSARYPYVSADGPPADGSHIQVEGMHFIAEMDSSGNPTGRVRLGNPEDVD